MNLGLQDKVALVTGGASGIGEAIVRLLAEESSRTVIVDRDHEKGERLAAELSASGRQTRFVKAELSEEKACRDCVEIALSQFGRLDVLINNAGVNDSVGLEKSPREFMSSLGRNLFHVFAVTHFAETALKASRGAIVNLSSKVSFTGQGATSGYAAAKGGINALTREWALALAPFGVRANCVVPAECATPQYEKWLRALPDPEGTRAAIEGLVPLERRMTRTEEVAAMVVFLASPRSSHTTGQIIFVDGGYTHLGRASSHPHSKWG
jgi:NAD(P)-dependent dehydrogenase (short-subunit alcohol dehydrogenase family)